MVGVKIQLHLASTVRGCKSLRTKITLSLFRKEFKNLGNFLAPRMGLGRTVNLSQPATHDEKSRLIATRTLVHVVPVADGHSVEMMTWSSPSISSKTFRDNCVVSLEKKCVNYIRSINFISSIPFLLIIRPVVDSSRLYAMGISNGAMLTWSMAQDDRIAPLLAGIAPMIGVPHNDYRRGKGTPRNLPVIGIYGTYDDVVPPGNYREDISVDDAGYFWIPAHRMHQKWAQDHGCPVQRANQPAPYTYYNSNNLNGMSVQCRTYCPSDSPPYSVDCRMNAGHDTPSWMLQMSLDFFEMHYGRSQNRQKSAEGKDGDGKN